MSFLEKELFLSCFRGDVDSVKYYLRKGANMNFICPMGRTPFGVAAQLGNVEILQTFLDHCQHDTKVQFSTSANSKASNTEKNKNSFSVKKPNLGYFVCVHNEPKSLNCTIAQSDINLNSDVERQDCNDDVFKSKSEEDSDTVMSAMSKVAYDLATINDSLVRRDPRFKSNNWMSDNIKLSLEDGDTTPDGMDRLEWDMEVEKSDTLISSKVEEDPWCALYLWYTDIILQNSSVLKENPNDIDRQDRFGCRALHYATVEGHTDAVKLLINAGCKVNVGDLDNLTPLHMAAARDNPLIMELLINAGANVHHKTMDRISPLHVSASRGLLNNVKLLLNAGAHIDTLDSSDRTPLFMAVSRSHVDVVAYLLERGAKVNLGEIHGYTPTYEAVWQKNTTIVKMLLDAGAKITQSHHLLHYAVLHRHKEMVSLLISAGSVINLRDENGDTPLVLAAKTHHTEIVRLLLQNGASVNCKSYITGHTPLHEIINNSSGECQKFGELFSIFQEFNVDLESESNAGYTPLCLAINQRFNEAAAILIRHGADVNHPRIFQFNLFGQILSQKNRFLSELFIYSGYHFRSIQLSFEPSTPSEKWISQLKVNPLKLCDLCRIIIRKRFKTKVYENVSRLILPSAIKTFLKLEDIIQENYWA